MTPDQIREQIATFEALARNLTVAVIRERVVEHVAWLRERLAEAEAES